MAVQNDFHDNKENKDPNRESFSFRPSSDLLTFILNEIASTKEEKKTKHATMMSVGEAKAGLTIFSNPFLYVRTFKF